MQPLSKVGPVWRVPMYLFVLFALFFSGIQNTSRSGSSCLVLEHGRVGYPWFMFQVHPGNLTHKYQQ